ncbi:terpenoid synthase [Hymenopellis radicata]|nr:terpenoid synthase [Hymenopellis radicata]
MAHSQTVLLPDLPSYWPFAARENPLATAELVSTCDRWVEDNAPFDATPRSSFMRCNFALFASLVYPNFCDVAHVRAVIEQMHLYYVIDKLTDGNDGPTVRKQCDEVLNALRNPHDASSQESCLGKMTREFWIRTLEDAQCTSSTAERYIQHFQEYLDSTYRQAFERDNQNILSIDEYLNVRRAGSGAHPSLDLILIQHDLPNDVYDHPFVSKMMQLAVEVMMFVNDVYSFPMELRSEDPYHNLVVVVMKEKGLDVQGALDYIGERFQEMTKEFSELFANVPVFPGHIGTAVNVLLEGIAVAVAGQIEWCFRTERYFGKSGEEVKRRRIVEL